jgi:hypothetical protein
MLLDYGFTITLDPRSDRTTALRIDTYYHGARRRHHRRGMGIGQARPSPGPTRRLA